MSDDKRRPARVDLADFLLVAGVLALLVAVYLIGGAAWVLAALGVLAIVVALGR